MLVREREREEGGKGGKKRGRKGGREEGRKRERKKRKNRERKKPLLVIMVGHSKSRNVETWRKYVS